MNKTAPNPVFAEAAGAVTLADLGALRVSGADAEAFLNAQVSNDLRHLGTDRSLLAAWCDAKGRALAVFRILRWGGEGFLLIVPKSLIPAVLPRLKMFVLRARVAIDDARETIQLRGVFGRSALGRYDTAAPPTPDSVIHIDEVAVIRLPGPDERVLLAGPAAALSALAPETESAPVAPAWRLADIRAGLPWIEPATQGEFVPQMLNLHWLGGIDFHKGCYPGQEVIARLHYRGKLKRRLYRAATIAKAAPGDAVLGADGNNEGTVLGAAANAADEQELLAVIRVAAADSALTLVGQPLLLLDLPYATTP